jgi:uncharacterized protein YegP (UPF0339 family)
MKNSIAIRCFVLALSLAACGGVDGTGAGDPNTTGDGDGKADGVSAGRFETFTGADGRYYFHLLAGNGQKVLASQGYASLRNAQDGIDTVRFNGTHTEAYQLLEAADGEWYFNLLAGNYEVIGTSELYVSKSNAQRGISTVVGLLGNATEGPCAGGARFQVFTGLDGQWYFHLRAANCEIVLQSQAYTRRSSAVDGTASVRTNGPNLARYQVKDAANGQAYFVLTAANNQVIGVGETYASRDNAERGVAAVQALLSDGASIPQVQ